MFEKLLRSNNLENPSTSLANAQAWFLDMFSDPTASGVTVNAETALMYSAVWRAISVYSHVIGSLPLKLYKKDGDSRVEANDHWAYKLMHDSPNKYMSSFTYRSSLITRTHLYGNGISKIVRNPMGEVVALIFLPAENTKPKIKGGKKVIVTHIQAKDGTTIKKTYQDDEVFHLMNLSTDGIAGISTIQNARESIGLGLTTEKYGSALFGKGATMSGVFSHPGRLGDKAHNRLKKDLKGKTGQSGMHELLVLEEGMKFERLSMQPEDAQFLQTRLHQIKEIANWFNLPAYMLNNGDNAIKSNVEQQALDLVKYSFRPWLINIEQELNRKILTSEDRANGYYFEHNLAGLLRGDSEQQMAFWKEGILNGIFNPNYVRKQQNLPGYKGGDSYWVPANYQQITPDGTIVQYNPKGKGNGNS